MSRPKKRKGGRVTPKGTRPGSQQPSGPTPTRAGPAVAPLGPDPVATLLGDDFDLFDEDPEEELGLLEAVLAAVEGDEPLTLLALASGGAQLMEPGDGVQDEERPGWDGILATLTGTDVLETTALLWALVPFLPEAEADRVRAELGRRHDHGPAWLRSIGEIEVTGAWELGDVLGDGQDIQLELRWPTGHEGTFSAYVDHNMGTLVKDAAVLPGPTDWARRSISTTLVDGAYIADVDVADAALALGVADERWGRALMGPATREWPMVRPLLHRILSGLADGAAADGPEVDGAGPGRTPTSAERIHEIVDEFLDAPEGVALRDDPDARALLESVVTFGVDHGIADPYKWSEVRIEVVLVDWFPRKVAGERSTLERLPDVLRAWVPYAHRRLDGSGDLEQLGEVAGGPRVPPAETQASLDAIDRWEPDYLCAIGDEDRSMGADAIARSVLDSLRAQT